MTLQSEIGTKIITPDLKIKYIGFFILSVLLISMIGGTKTLYYFLILVLIGQVLGYWNKYDISISTPEIFKES